MYVGWGSLDQGCQMIWLLVYITHCTWNCWTFVIASLYPILRDREINYKVRMKTRFPKWGWFYILKKLLPMSYPFFLVPPFSFPLNSQTKVLNTSQYSISIFILLKSIEFKAVIFFPISWYLPLVHWFTILSNSCNFILKLTVWHL